MSISATEFEELNADLAATLADVLSTVLSQEAVETTEPMTPGPLAIASLAMHDEASGGYTGVELQVGTGLARMLASRMMSVAAPQDEDVIDAISELGNIAAGSTKSLLFQHARLSLPSSRIIVSADDSPSVEGHHVRAMVLGHVVQLTIIPDVDAEGLIWPPVVSDELIGRLS